MRNPTKAAPDMTVREALDTAGNARAVLAWINADGTIITQPVGDNESVLNIERDLISHLNSEPYSDAWLAKLLNYITVRLEGRRMASDAQSIAIPIGCEWQIVSNRNVEANHA
ncbi:hypothetical protein [Paraburkholderia adhaesiva]|uniref:hypothetical protein n=1 Tax=Paraburkholderia adhaesiva TaxID=2883244 RepID=UPI001F2A9C45|nr:hypothetical protein [Paraburkholderia adhaesiva]